MIGKIEHLALNNITLCDDGTLQDDITGLKIELTKCVFFFGRNGATIANCSFAKLFVLNFEPVKYI